MYACRVHGHAAGQPAAEALRQAVSRIITTLQCIQKNSSNSSYWSFSPPAHVLVDTPVSRARISRPPLRPRPKIPFTHARTRLQKNFLENSNSRPPSRPEGQKGHALVTFWSAPRYSEPASTARAPVFAHTFLLAAARAIFVEFFFHCPFPARRAA